MIQDEAVEAAVAKFRDMQGYYTTAYCVQKALEAASPHMLAGAWADGHESGFWNGRESHGDVTGVLIGVDHANARNPYRTAK